MASLLESLSHFFCPNKFPEKTKTIVKSKQRKGIKMLLSIAAAAATRKRIYIGIRPDGTTEKVVGITFNSACNNAKIDPNEFRSYRVAGHDD